MYSDKSNAACFAQLSIWLVLTHVSNLPSYISNHNSGYTGNTMLGFLPKVHLLILEIACRQLQHLDPSTSRWGGFVTLGKTCLEGLSHVLDLYPQAVWNRIQGWLSYGMWRWHCLFLSPLCSNPKWGLGRRVSLPILLLSAIDGCLVAVISVWVLVAIIPSGKINFQN